MRNFWKDHGVKGTEAEGRGLYISGVNPHCDREALLGIWEVSSRGFGGNRLSGASEDRGRQAEAPHLTSLASTLTCTPPDRQPSGPSLHNGLHLRVPQSGRQRTFSALLGRSRTHTRLP